MTRGLFSRRVWPDVLRLLEDRDRALVVALDLDGTLAPIVSRPELARVPLRTLRYLSQAAEGRNARVAVVSARPLKDMKRMLPVRGLLLSAQYGLEGTAAPAPEALRRYRRACARMGRVLQPLVREVPGAVLERKGYTLGVHYRNVTGERRVRELLRSVRAAARIEGKRLGFVPVLGQRVVDFVPRGFDKGRILRALRPQAKMGSMVYFGDSPGDEPAFRSLRASDIGVRVGSGGTQARYRVANPTGVTRFLGAVAAYRAGSAGTRRWERAR